MRIPKEERMLFGKRLEEARLHKDTPPVKDALDVILAALKTAITSVPQEQVRVTFYRGGKTRYEYGYPVLNEAETELDLKPSDNITKGNLVLSLEEIVRVEIV